MPLDFGTENFEVIFGAQQFCCKFQQHQCLDLIEYSAQVFHYRREEKYFYLNSFKMFKIKTHLRSSMVLRHSR